MQNQNQQLTVKAQALSNQIAAAGANTTPLAFAKKTTEFRKLKDLAPGQIGDGLGLIFVRVANLLGIKEAIPQNAKDDIRELILSRFQTLSLEEIDYAFKLDRFGAFGEPTPHYQLFNSEYVGKVLNRFKEWLRVTRFENNLPTAKSLKAPELTPEEKEAIVIKGVLDCFDWYLMTKEIKPGKIYVYTFLYDLKVLPVHSPEFRSQIARKAAKIACKRTPENRTEAKELKSLLKDLTAGKNKQTTLCKELVLKYYFSSLIAQRRDLRDILREKGVLK